MLWNPWRILVKDVHKSGAQNLHHFRWGTQMKHLPECVFQVHLLVLNTTNNNPHQVPHCTQQIICFQHPYSLKTIAFHDIFKSLLHCHGFIEESENPWLIGWMKHILQIIVCHKRLFHRRHLFFTKLKLVEKKTLVPFMLIKDFSLKLTAYINLIVVGEAILLNHQHWLSI